MLRDLFFLLIQCFKKRIKMISLAKKWNCPDKITDIRTRQAKGAKFQHTLGIQYTAANLSFIIVIRNGKIVWKHGPYCRCFPLNLKYPGWPYRAYIKIAKNGNFCKEWLSENDIEAVLATFCFMTMVPRLLRQFRRSLQIKKSIANAPPVL